LIFVVLGLEFGVLIDTVPPGTLGMAAKVSVVICLVAMVVRLIWVPLATYLPRALSAEVRRRDPLPEWKPVFLVSWTSMRGIVSLASALALPRVLADGTPWPYRSELLLVTMGVILLTLMLQGLTLGPIIRSFKFTPDDSHHEEERLARREALRRGAEALEDMSREPWVDQRDVEWLRNELRDRLRLHEHHGGGTKSRRKLRIAVMNAERRMLIRLRNEGAISDEVLRELEQELDLDAMRVGAGNAS
jgi:CPA1 family monovalent cation:H+ antiporter